MNTSSTQPRNLSVFPPFESEDCRASMAAPGHEQGNTSAAKSLHALHHNIEIARNALTNSKKSLRGVLRLPAEGIASRYRRLLVSEVMLDRSNFLDNVRSLNSTTRKITHACRDWEGPEDNLFITEITEAVLDFNKRSRTLMIRFSNALSRIMALRRQIDEQINKPHSSPSSTARVQHPRASANAAKGIHLIKEAFSKFLRWLSIIPKYVGVGANRESDTNQSTDVTFVESGDLLVLALALSDLDVLFRSMSDLIVSIGEYMRIATDETDMLVGLLVTDPTDIDKSTQGLRHDMVLYEAVLDQFEERMPADCSKERLTEIEADGEAACSLEVTEMSEAQS